MSVTELAEECGQRWGKLSDGEKKKWEDRNNKLKKNWQEKKEQVRRYSRAFFSLIEPTSVTVGELGSFLAHFSSIPGWRRR